jgi:hypothetical protein
VLQWRFISGWKKFLILLAILDTAIILADFVAAFFYGARLRAYADWLFGTTDTETFGSLLFIEAALIIGVGAMLAAGYPENKEASAQGSPRTPYVAEKISEQRAEFREKQISTGFLLMLVGAPLLIIPVLLII